MPKTSMKVLTFSGLAVLLSGGPLSSLALHASVETVLAIHLTIAILGVVSGMFLGMFRGPALKLAGGIVLGGVASATIGVLVLTVIHVLTPSDAADLMAGVILALITAACSGLAISLALSFIGEAIDDLYAGDRNGAIDA
jgi:hypothetical protein